ncbi:MAG: hypothetical protein OXF65_00015 [Acidimicrobiaceae bacterium]|nr:hypothetical protein [Acidimicrobiaceae bacterium]
MSAQARPPVRTQRSRDESGGAVTLLVMLMVPVFVLAAVVAAAVPRRLAAHSAADAAAGNLASLAVAWRDTQALDHGPVSWFFPECVPASSGTPTDGEAAAQGPELRRACELLTESVLAGLSARGFDGDTVAGFYSSSYTTSAQTTTDDTEHPASLPCHAGGRTVVVDAVHLGLAADWATADWAAAQTWPRGLRIGSEAVGAIRVNRAGGTIGEPACGDVLGLVPLDARPADDGARQFAESLPTRTAFGR